MAEHAADTTVQRHACSVLGTAGVADTLWSSKIVNLGGIKSALSAIKQHPSDALVQVNCLMALQAFASCKEGGVALSEQHVLETILKVIVKNFHNSDIRDPGFWTLQNIAVSGKQARSTMRSLGVRDVTQRAVKEGSE